MYIRFSAFLPIVALAAVAAAAPSALEARSSSTSECNTGPIQCCDSTYSSSDTSFTYLLGLLGIFLPSGTSGLVGLSCSGVGSTVDCSQQPVCCNGNTFSGLINIGCSPININL